MSLISQRLRRLFIVHSGQNNQKGRRNIDIWLRRIRGDDSASPRHAGVRDQQLAHSQERKTINNSNRAKGQIVGRQAPVVYIWGLGGGGSVMGGREAQSKCQGAGEGEEDRGKDNNTLHSAGGKCFHAAFSDGQRAKRQSRRSSAVFHFLTRPLVLVPFRPSGTFCSWLGQICS